MARNKSSKTTSFGVTDDLDFFSTTSDNNQILITPQVQQVQEVYEVQKEIGTTQGKKGQRLKRINMAFSDMNHEYITKESRRRGISGTAFVNQIIDEYRMNNH